MFLRKDIRLPLGWCAWILLLGLFATSCVASKQPLVAKVANVGKSSKPAKSSKSPPVAVEFEGNATHELKRASSLLQHNYERFLAREPLGFDSDTVARVGPAVVQAWRKTAEGVDMAAGNAPLQNAIPFVIIALMLVALGLLDRQAWALALTTQGRTYTAWWGWLQVFLRVVIVVAGRCLPVAVVVALSYFPVQAIFGREGWTRALTQLLWLLMAYRALRTALEASFAFEVFEVSDDDAVRVERWGRWALRLMFMFLGAIAITTRLQVGRDVRALAVFAYELALVALPISLLTLKPSVMAMFPNPDGGFYARLHRGVDRYFRAILVVSALLLGLRAAGYVNASTFILVRGYSLFLLVIFTVTIGARIAGALQTDGEDRPEEQGRLYRSIEWAMRVIGVIVLLYVALALLDVWDPLVVVLKIRLVSVGATSISAFSILKSAFFFLCAVLIARLARALLVMRIFPAFDVDVGVGYAVQTLVNYALILIGFFVALIALGVDLSAMTVVLASLGVGIGFGLQTLTENLISGFILLFGRSVKKGDIITVGETYGHVEAVGARSVVVRTPDNFDMLIPSKEIVGSQIVNWSYRDTLVRHKVLVGVSYSASPREVEKVLLKSAKQHEKVLPEPAPEVWLTGFGDSSVNFALLVFFDCREITRDRLNGQLNFIIWDELEAAGIEIPFPQRDLHLKSVEVPPGSLSKLR